MPAGLEWGHGPRPWAIVALHGARRAAAAKDSSRLMLVERPLEGRSTAKAG